MEVLETPDAWKRACSSSVDRHKAFSGSREYGFKDQITRAALSIPSNIAEGYERDSLKSRVQFLKIAKGSCGELWTQLLIGRAAGFLNAETSQLMEQETKELSKMLHGLIRHYQGQIDDVPRS
ncbi:MAG: four helix bundle protein [Gammaproteobacteria bacterium]